MTQVNKKTSAETEVLENESKEIVAQNNQIVNFDIQTIITHAIDQKIPVDTMERLLAMAEKMQAIKAKQEFDRAMAKFQSECPTIVKTKEVHTKSGQLAYKYAPIESIVQQVKIPLQDNGFSYSTQQEMLEKAVKIIIKVTHIMGHSEVTEMSVPLGSQTQIMNDSQVVAAASTFAKRYAFLNAFGIMTGDEDTDSRVEGKPEYNYQEQIKPFDDSNVLKLILADLAACDTALEYELRASDIKIAKENGKLSESSYKLVVEACKETVKRIQGKGLKPVEKPLTPGEKMIAKGKELKAQKVLTPAEVVEQANK